MLTILSKDLALEKVISLIYFKSSNLNYSELEFWTNFCPFYRLDLYGEWPMVKITHTQVLDNSLKNTSRSRATYSRLHDTSCCSIFNMLELPGFLPETAVTCISYFLSICVPWRRSLLPVSMTSAPWEVPQEKAALGQLCRDTQPSRGIFLLQCPRQEWTQGSCPTSLTLRCWWESWEKSLCQRGSLLYLLLEVLPSPPTACNGKKKLKLNFQSCRFFGKKTSQPATVRSCSFKGKISKSASKNFVNSSGSSSKAILFQAPPMPIMSVEWVFSLHTLPYKIIFFFCMN